MKKSLLYILIHFSSAVIADWITVEHDLNMCDQDVPSNHAAFHIHDDDGITYSTSLLVRGVQILKHEPPLTTVNVTMWGCTYDCKFSFMVKINREDLSVSSYTENDINNYKCNLSNYTIKLIPTPKITYMQKEPNPDHVFPTDLTAMYCSQGKHPDAPEWAINQTEHVAECIDYLTGHEVGTYAASLEFGSGSSFNPEGYGVATRHMIDSANKLFNYWERHHRGFHDAFNELSVKMTPNNLKELIPPPPPPPKQNLILLILIPIAAIVIFAAPYAWEALTATAEVIEATETSIEMSELGAGIAAADDTIASTSEGTVARNAATGWRNSQIESKAANKARNLYKEYKKVKELAGECVDFGCNDEEAIEEIASAYRKSQDTNIAQILSSLNRAFPPDKKRDTMPVDNIGFFTANMVNVYFLPSLLENVHQSFTGDNQNYPDISSYLSAASEHLQFHFEDTLHNNFFAANKSILASFTVNQGVNYDQILDSDDDVYNTIKSNTYNNLAASIISVTLREVGVEICNPKPSFCGQPCDSGHIYCPIVGNDTNSCVISAADSQISELKFLRDPFDICSTDKSTGWNITHNSNCDIKQFQCQ